MLQKMLWLSLAGALGTLARYGLAGFVHRNNHTFFPWGTVAVNVVGCLLVGLIWALLENRWPVSSDTRIFILVGFMGAFTTFSTFILETIHLFQTAEWLAGAGNILLQNGLGFLAFFAGMILGRSL